MTVAIIEIFFVSFAIELILTFYCIFIEFMMSRVSLVTFPFMKKATSHVFNFELEYKCEVSI